MDTLSENRSAGQSSSCSPTPPAFAACECIPPTPTKLFRIRVFITHLVYMIHATVLRSFTFWNPTLYFDMCCFVHEIMFCVRRSRFKAQSVYCVGTLRVDGVVRTAQRTDTLVSAGRHPNWKTGLAASACCVPADTRMWPLCFGLHWLMCIAMTRSYCQCNTARHRI